MAARRSVVEIEDAMGRHKVVNTPFRFTNATAGISGLAPDLGSDTDAVLSEVLALDDLQLKDLHARKVTGSGKA